MNILKPIIAVTCNFGFLDEDYPSKNPHPPMEFDNVSDNYIKAVENAGGIPMVLPIYNDEKTIKEALERVDGILFTGGDDVGPHHFGEFPSKNLGNISNSRDLQEIAAAKYVLNETQKPVLGICRGLQLLNIAAGGTLYQDLTENGFNNHTIDAYPRYIPSHKNKIYDNTRLKLIVKTDMLGVNSYHHQTVKDVAKGFKISAESEDGLIEALEGMDNNRFLLGVQWHPEAMQSYEEHRNIFRAFIESAENNMK